jgi:lysine 2,3-aminomutase
MSTKTLRTISSLVDGGLVEKVDAGMLEPVAARYAVAITPLMADTILSQGPALHRQFVPGAAELHISAEERADPIGDERHSPVPGVVHRYPDRVLLKLTHLCPVYCRFCFRREMVGPGEDAVLSGAALEAALSYIAAHKDIWEVILTGGDPFILSARRIAEISARLAAISHVKVLRWHTRVPVVDPARITSALARALKRKGKAVFVVLHANHASELTNQAREACARLIDAGIPMLSQSVLLKGVNDDAEALEALMRALVENRVKPYYLHHGDLAPGTSHFRTGIEEGQELTRTLRARASGLCQPSYVLDIPGGYAKARLDLCDAEVGEAGTSLRDGEGHFHAYPPKAAAPK